MKSHSHRSPSRARRTLGATARATEIRRGLDRLRPRAHARADGDAHRATSPIPDQAMADLLGGRNPEANQAIASLFAGATAEMPRRVSRQASLRWAATSPAWRCGESRSRRRAGDLGRPQPAGAQGPHRDGAQVPRPRRVPRRREAQRRARRRALHRRQGRELERAGLERPHRTRHRARQRQHPARRADL